MGENEKINLALDATSRKNVRNATLSVLLAAIQGEPVTADAATLRKTIKRKKGGKLELAGGSVTQHDPTDVLDHNQETLRALQTSFGMYCVGGVAGMIVEFQKGPTLGIYGRVRDKHYVVDIDREVITRLSPIVGLTAYIKKYHNASLQQVFSFQVFTATEMVTLEEREVVEQAVEAKKAAKKRKSKMSTEAEEAETPALAPTPKKKPKTKTAKKAELVEEQDDNDDDNSNNNNEATAPSKGDLPKAVDDTIVEVKEVVQASTTKKRGRKKMKEADAFDLLTGGSSRSSRSKKKA